MSLSQSFITSRTRKETFYKQLDYVIDWQSLDRLIRRDYSHNGDVVDRTT